MSVRSFIRDLVIGRDNFIESHGEFKQVMLSGHFALISITISAIYLVMHYIQGAYQTLPVFAITIVLLVFSLIQHRKGNHCRANYIMLPTVNIAVYIFAASEPASTGIFIFFVSTSIAAFAVLSYKQRLLSILFAVSSYVLFVLAYFIDFSILPRRDYSQDMILFNIVVNFTAALPASVMGIYIMISLNHYNALQLLANNKLLAKANSELDSFVYSTFHDLRAPLSSVLGLIDISQRSGDMNEMTKYMGLMKERVNSLDKFIKDITDYSKNNRLDIVHERVKLHEMVSEIWESLRYTPEARSINFNIDIPEQVVVTSDKNRLSIIISNLLSNAIRYHDLRKEEKYIRLHHQVNGKGFYIKVEDNGQGIATEYHSKIFDMFYRGNEKSKGSGLGLYIVKETIHKLSGSIKLDSTPGMGTTFTMKFPYHQI